jgi:hypothetical protein
MAMSEVRKLTLAYIRGEVPAAQVINRVRTKPAPEQKTPEQISLETSEDFTEENLTENTWADVGRYWDMMTPDQQDELTKARQRKFGKD